MLGRMSNGASATYAQSPVTRKKWRARSYVSLVLFIVATLLTPIAVIGHWGHETIANPEQYINTVGPLAENPEIQQAVADTVSDAIIEKVDTSRLPRSVDTYQRACAEGLHRSTHRRSDRPGAIRG